MKRTYLAAIPLLLLNLLPTTALGQPVDDPGLTEPPPPAKPTAKPSKPPSTSGKPAPPRGAAGATTPLSPGPLVLPPLSSFQAGESERVEETVAWLPGNGERPADEDLYETTAAPSLSGPIGLYRMLTADSGKTYSFRVGLNLQVFRQSDFLVSGSGSIKGDVNTRFLGNLNIGFTPWKYLELYLALFNASNQNRRSDPDRRDPEVILSLGDVAFGAKGHVPLARWWDLGLHLGVKFFNSVSAVTPKGAATSFTADLISSWDLRRAEATRNVPLRFHFNFGYVVDNSIKLLPADDCTTSTGNDACVRSRVVQTFAYGVEPSRFRLAAAADVPITFRRPLVGLEIFGEYHAEIAVGDGDQTILRVLSNDGSIGKARLTGASLQYLTFGVRVRPVAGLVLDAGVDVGLSSPGFQYGPPVPPWNVILGAAYAYDPVAARGRTKVVTRTITRELARPSNDGKLRGFVRDAATKKAIGGATIRYTTRRANPQLTAEDGGFLSYGFAPGPIALEIARDDYETTKVDTVIPANGETPLEVLLTAKPPQHGTLQGRVADDAGSPVSATVRLTNPQTGSIVDAEPQGIGGFIAKLPQGDYSMDVTADGFLARQRQVTVNAGQPTNVEVVLRKRPTTSHVSIGKGEIIIKGVVHFGTNNADIRPDGQQLLDEVADVMVKHPELRRVRVEGHTDNRGATDRNLQLSKERAAAVVAYLVKQGIDPVRLESEGFGSSTPLVPNITPAQRAKNRRVAFKILDSGPAATP